MPSPRRVVFCPLQETARREKPAPVFQDAEMTPRQRNGKQTVL